MTGLFVWQGRRAPSSLRHVLEVRIVASKKRSAQGIREGMSLKVGSRTAQGGWRRKVSLGGIKSRGKACRELET